MPYAIDLFCGAGGMSEGLIQAGFHIVFSSDINPIVEKTYRARHEQLGLVQGLNTFYRREDIKNLTGSMIRADVSSLEIFKNKECPHIDAIFGGPPCQGFSRAGRRDPNDPRNMLFREYVRVIDEIKPDYVVVENVLGFIDMRLPDFIGYSSEKYPDNMTVPDILEAELNKIGYDMSWKILNASDYGVPQRRNRIIVLAHRKNILAPDFPSPLFIEPLTVKDAIADLIHDDSIRQAVNPTLSDYQSQSVAGRTPDIHGYPVNSGGTIHNNELPRHSDIVKERFSLFKEGEDGAELRNRIKSEGIDLTRCPNLIELCSSEMGLLREQIVPHFQKKNLDEADLDVLLTKKAIRIRISSNHPSPTMVTMPDDFINPFEPRTLSVREMARLQSFDDSFEFLGKRTTGGLKRRVEIPQYSQVGNAVPPLLAKAVALQIVKAINNNQGDETDNQ